MVEMKVVEILKSDIYNHKYIAQVNSLENKITTGKVLLLVQKDSIDSILEIDHSILTKTAIKVAPYSKNPSQFEYKEYLQTLNIYHQTIISPSEILQKETVNISVRGTAEKIREFLIEKLSKTPIPIKERAIIHALVLGQKRDIEKVKYQEFAAAGAVHILAVSGLHVGIIYLLLFFISRPFLFLKYGRIIQSLFIVLLLWSYAYITGLSPSVCRAVTMFSFLAFAKFSKRKTSTANTLLLSFLFLLLYNPLLIFHVGFQMSYMAVLAIIIIQPKLNSYYNPRNYFKRLFWGILTVTFAAQIGIMPISLYYFHQFPGLFFISNLVILPFLSFILSGGILIILLAALDCPWNWVYQLYAWLVSLLNNFISWIARQQSFLISDIYFSAEMLLSSYILIICIFLFWIRQSYARLAFVLISILIFLGVFNRQTIKDQTHQLVIFHKSRNSLIAVKEQNNLTIISTDTNEVANKYPIKSYKVARNINNVDVLKFQNVFNYNQQLFTIVDSTGVYDYSVKKPVVILLQSPKINLERLIDSIQPIQIIADGTNYRSYVERWRKTCVVKKIPFHSTYEKGAFIVN